MLFLYYSKLCAYAHIGFFIMPRWRKRRCCRFLNSDRIYKPRGIPFNELDIVELFIDEFEAVRLCDHEKLSQIEAAARMNISRGTVQRLLESGRFKIIDAILNNKAIRISNKWEKSPNEEMQNEDNHID